MHKLLEQFSTGPQVKNGKFSNCFFDILTIHNDEISYVKHILGLLCVFFHPIWVGGLVTQGGSGTACSCSFPASGSQKRKFPKLIFYIFRPSKMMKYPMQSMFQPLFMCFSPYLGVFFCGGGGGVPRGLGHNLLMQLSSLCSSKMEISETDFLNILTIHNYQISYVKYVLDPIHVLWTGARGWGTTCNFPLSTFQK